MKTQGLLFFIPSILLMSQAPAELPVKREALLELHRLGLEGQMVRFLVVKKLAGSAGEGSVSAGSKLWVRLKGNGSQDLEWAQCRMWEETTGKYADLKLVVEPGGSAPGLGDFPQVRVVNMDRVRLMTLFKVEQDPGAPQVRLKALVDIPDEDGKAAIPAGGFLSLVLTKDKALDLAKAEAVGTDLKSIPDLRLAFKPGDLKISPAEFGTLNRILLTEDLIKEHFRIRSVDPVPSTDGYHRVVLMTTGDIKASEGGPVFKGEGQTHRQTANPEDRGGGARIHPDRSRAGAGSGRPADARLSLLGSFP